MSDQHLDNPLGGEDILLLVAAGATDGAYPLDAIRAMKGCFLVAQRGREPWKEQFDFRPYDYGPFDSSVYHARDALIAKDLLSEVPGYYPSYTLTDAGCNRVAELERQLGSDAGWIKKIGQWTTSRSFSELLREVYAEFPEFASRSVARVG